MIFNFNMSFTDDEWKLIILEYLRVWTGIPLTPDDGYDVEELKFFDGLLGTLLKQTESLLKEYPSFLDEEFVDSWKYQGKIYRVIHPHYVFDDDSVEPRTVMPEVNYHRMITHWTSDYTFKGLLATAKIFDDEEYIILEADTGEHLAFDVNKFRQVNNAQEIYTQGENEIIFPMYRENIKEYRMTIKEFIRMKKQEQPSNAKKKDKPQVINNIGELKLDIDYDKLAEAIVKAKQIEEDNATKKNAEDLAAWRESIGKKDYEDKKGLMKIIFVVCNRIKVATKIIFYPKNKRLYKSMTGAFMQGVTATFFNVVKWFLWVLTAGFIGSLFFHGETEFTFLQYCTSIGGAILAFVLAGIFRLMAIETEQMTDRERILGIFTAVVSVYPLIEKAIELFKGVG